MLGMAAALLIAFGLVMIVVGFETTSTPDFCGTCHVMKPYYQSWSTSTHNRVACVECHISPGVTAELRKKWEAMSMVAKYVTATYGGNPWAEVDDAACLRCHERRLLEGRVMFKGVRFDHTPHLIQMRKGKKLRCTSCHSQIVQGTHVAVTSSTCVLCHFKDEIPGSGTAKCTVCHDVPAGQITTHKGSFDHGQVKTYGMECTRCHVNASSGDGAVPPERCLTCHNDPERLGRYGEGEFLHRKHVTDHKVDCMNCHLEIRHAAGDALQTHEPSCSACHASGHSPQEMLYSGSGGRGVPETPSGMYAAGVRCEGCHTSRRGIVDHATSVSCMSCHGAEYLKIYEGWQAGLDARLQEARRALDAGRARLGADDPAVADAAHNFELVLKGRGVHNVPYALALLDSVQTLIDDRLRAKGVAVAERKRPPYRANPCYSCHQGIELQEGRFAGRSFRHGRHLIDAALACESCHRPHESRQANEVVRFGKAGCVDCHHREPVRDCQTCHDASKLPAEQRYKDRLFSHAFHLSDAGLSCTDCHSAEKSGSVRLNEEACTACHESS